MAGVLRLPRITASGEREQLAQIKSYLCSLVSDLQAALEEKGRIQENEYRSNPKTPSSVESNFNEIKSLIIRSAEIVNAYSEEISKRLEGVYLAKSDFGTFAEETAHEITANATALESVFTNLSALQSSLNNVQTGLLEANAYFRSGLLAHSEDGIPVYGLEIGQRTVVDGEEIFDKYARFTADRLSFYDRGGAEVAYISDYKLYITSARVSGSLTLGKYAVDTVDGLAWRWQ